MRLPSMVLLLALLSSPAVEAQDPAFEEAKKIGQAETLQLEQFLNDTAAAAFAVTITAPLEDRRARSKAMIEEIYRGDRSLETARRAFSALVMRPESTTPMTEILMSARSSLNLIHELDQGRSWDFFERMYEERSRIGTASAPAIEWKEGYAELLFNMGRYADARREMQEVAQTRGETLRPFARSVAAVIEHVNGDADAIKRYVSQCSSPEDCWSNIGAIADRALPGHMIRKADVRPVLDVLIAAGRARPHDYGNQLRVLKKVVSFDKDAAEREWRRMATASDLPPAARHDAALALAQLMKGTDARESAAWTDCSLRFYDVTIPSFPEDGWRQLVSYAKTPRVNKDCAGDPERAECVLASLSNRVYAASYSRDWSLAKQSIEQVAIWTLTQKLNVFTLAQHLQMFGEQLIGNQLRDEGTSAIEFALLLDPRAEVSDQLSYRVFRPAHESATPWKSPTVIEKPLPAVCP